MAPETPSTTDAVAHGDPAVAEAGHGAATAAGTEVAHESGGGGLPQFDFAYWGGQIVWLLILFAILYVLFARVFVPRFRKVADMRAQTIADSLDNARQVQAEADAQAAAVKAEIDRARSESRKLVIDARTKAAEELAKSQAAQDAELATQMDQAEQRIRAMRDQAMGNVRGIAGETARAIVDKLTGKAVSAAEAKAVEGNVA